MQKLKVRYLILITILGLTSVIANSLGQGFFTSAESSFNPVIDHIPLTFGKWDGKDVKLESSVYDILETKYILHRNYMSRDGNQIFLSVVHYPNSRVDFHIPEACLGGQGIQIRKIPKTVSLRLGQQDVQIDVNQLVWERNGNKTCIYYFYKAGNYYVNNYIDLRLKVALNKLSNDRPSATLVRVSTICHDACIADEYLLREFLSEVYPFLSKYL